MVSTMTVKMRFLPCAAADGGAVAGGGARRRAAPGRPPARQLEQVRA